MARTILIDTGAVVAALIKRDQHHGWARSNLESISSPCLTCEAVLSECFFLLERTPSGKRVFSALLERGIIAVDFSLRDQLGDTLRLIQQYRDTPMSFADACMVRMSELHLNSAVFTTDTEFKTYRRNGRQAIPLLAPW
jgi:predicted nucleic acid-binding protein